EASTHLAAFASGTTAAALLCGHAEPTRPLKLAFVCSGQGSQYLGMGQQLYQRFPPFRAALDRCAELLAPQLDLPLLSLLWGQAGAPPAVAQARLAQPRYTQPALFALEYALAELWRSWGVLPDALLGHSLGEYVAATLAGVLALDDALRLVV